MEMADGIIINKADGDNITKAEQAASSFRNALHLFPPSESGWTPKVLTYSGFYEYRIKEVWDMVWEYIDFVKKNGYFQYRRNEQSKYWMYETINESLKNGFYNDPEISALLGQCEKQILGGEQTSFAAAQKLLDLYYTKVAH